ncbi:hypothetical protein ELI30_17060 [Rhizobium leguminosarum]|nr:hypothetical protein ELI32_17760 [Rhizobium leguminosarum]TAV59267.1 hypothetical protein ELI31_16280 [Rhizobium leguminosarum]TAV70314.1 hypothetical protein ELI30_17060 [Rhizobium leguminosarum]TAY67931.1 hypothetical protein ELH82_17920 [Rhizobium leguminosarum]
MVDIVLSSRFRCSSLTRFYIAHDFLLRNLNFHIAAMRKKRLRLFIARYIFTGFGDIPCRIN